MLSATQKNTASLLQNLAASRLTVGFNEPGPTTPAGQRLIRVGQPRATPIAILTFELGEGLLVPVLGALLALVLGHGVGRVEAQPLLVIRLRRHPPNEKKHSNQNLLNGTPPLNGHHSSFAIVVVLVVSVPVVAVVAVRAHR